MIKPVKSLSPIYVRYFDNAEGTIYNLTESQYEKLFTSDDLDADIAVSERFEVQQTDEVGYVPPIVVTLSKIYGFEVESE